MYYQNHLFFHFYEDDKREGVWKKQTNKQTPSLESVGANYTDRATAACRRS
jgi:hypothetical protein